MRTPEYIRWNKEIVYNVIWSLLNALDQHNRTAHPEDRIKKVLLPGMGTGVGRISHRLCAQQTALAFKDFYEAKRDPESWSNISWGMANKYAGVVRKTHDDEMDKEVHWSTANVQLTPGSRLRSAIFYLLLYAVLHAIYIRLSQAW